MEYYGLSATAFSEAIDFNRSTISHLLSGRNKPSLEFVMKIVQTFPEVELYWLLNGKGSFPIKNEKNLKEASLSKTQSENDGEILTEVAKTPKPFKQQEEPEENKQIDRIVIFYSDGSFKSYKK